MRKPNEDIKKSKENRLKFVTDLWRQDPGGKKVDLVRLSSIDSFLNNGSLELKINLRYSNHELIRTMEPIFRLMRKYYKQKTGKELPKAPPTRGIHPRGFGQKELYSLCVAQQAIVHYRKSGLSYEKISKEFSKYPWPELLTPKAADFLAEPKYIERLYKKVERDDVTSNDALFSLMRYLLAGVNPTIDNFEKLMQAIEAEYKQMEEPYQSEGLQSLEDLRTKFRMAKQTKSLFSK
jgi:hypothetical protein